MQERLYKAKRLDNGEWVEGNLITDGVTDEYFIKISGNSVNLTDIVGQEGILHFFAHKINPVTIGQFVGELDVDGVKTFEGDIISPNGYEGQSQIRGTIKFGSCFRFDTYCKTEIGFWVEWETDSSGRYWRNDLGYWLLKSRVVGNAHDVM